MTGSYDPCLDNYAIVYYNKPDVQRALHATIGGDLTKWFPRNNSIFNNWKNALFSVLPIYKKTHKSRPSYMGIQVAGWTQDYEGLKFTTFYGAGHAVPNFGRKRALLYFKSYLSGTSLPNKK